MVDSGIFHALKSDTEAYAIGALPCSTSLVQAFRRDSKAEVSFLLRVQWPEKGFFSLKHVNMSTRGERE